MRFKILKKNGQILVLKIFAETMRGVIWQVVPDVSKDHSAFIFSSWTTLQHDSCENLRL